MTHVRKTLREEAFEWAFSSSNSKAKTQTGKEKAVEAYVKEESLRTWKYRGYVSLEEAYLADLHILAKNEMWRSLNHREEVAKERKHIKKYPVWTRYHVAQTAEAQKTYQSKAGTMNLPRWVEKIIEKIAFDDIFSGTRLRKVYAGNNTVNAGHREDDNGKGGWDRVVWHYADYTAIEKNGRIAYRYSDLDEYSDAKGWEIFHHFNNHLKIRGIIYKKPEEQKEEKALSPHHLRRFFNIAIPERSPVRWVWDMDEKAGYYLYGEEKYHTVFLPEKSSKEYLHEAVHAFQKRKKEQLESARAERVFNNLERVYISFEDSIEAGNCKAATVDMRNRIAKELHADGDFAVRADFVWKMRSDNYAKRAILKAAEHIRI